MVKQVLFGRRENSRRAFSSKMRLVGRACGRGSVGGVGAGDSPARDWSCGGLSMLAPASCLQELRTSTIVHCAAHHLHCNHDRTNSDALQKLLFFHQTRTGPSDAQMIDTPSLLQPQGRLSPAEALKVAQEAPAILRNNPKAISASPLQFLFSAPETADLWTIYENLLLSCLRAADDEAAQQCLERLVLRFGDKNPRVMAFNGLVKEAQASSSSDLDKVQAEYDVILEEDPLNVVC